mmetsp:Transcript_15443/g.33377  ORF Transcript_15443/g.33377 Transcript_15443/m.33377 type:complete len:232 (-) Transcript_15443:2121-2816(-)
MCASTDTRARQGSWVPGPFGSLRKAFRPAKRPLDALREGEGVVGGADVHVAGGEVGQGGRRMHLGQHVVQFGPLQPLLRQQRLCQTLHHRTVVAHCVLGDHQGARDELLHLLLRRLHYRAAVPLEDVPALTSARRQRLQGDGAEALAQPKLGDCLEGEGGGAVDVVGGAAGDAPAEHLLRRAAPEQRRQPPRHLVRVQQHLLLCGREVGEPEGSPGAGDDAQLLHLRARRH